MSAVATLNSLCSGHGGFPSRPPVESDPLITVNGIKVLVDGNQYPAHSDGNSAHPGQALSTRSWFTVEGKGLVCQGDPLSCGSTVAAGDSSFDVE